MLGGVGVLVVVTVVLVVVLTSDDSPRKQVTVDRSTVRGTAQAMLDGLMNRDPYTINEVSCRKATDEQVERAAANAGRAEAAPPLTITDVTENGSTAEVKVDAGSHGGGTMKLRHDADGLWCVARFRY